jgi:hypothetical protein
MIKSTTLTLIFILILLYAAFSPVPQVAMRRESAVPVQGEIIEGRSIFITRYDKRCNSWVEVLEV